MIMPIHGKPVSTVPLASLLGGTRAQLVRVEAATGVRARLVAMGFRPGVEVRVVSRSGRGPFVVAMDTSRIVLGRGMARHILVTPLAEDRPRK